MEVAIGLEGSDGGTIKAVLKGRAKEAAPEGAAPQTVVGAVYFNGSYPPPPNR